MSHDIVNINSHEQFEQTVLKAEQLTLVDFYADWCGPCKAITPILNELASDYANQLNIAKVDVDQQASLASHYQIRSIPTLLLVKDGKVMESLTGVQSKARLSLLIDEHR